MGRFFWQALVLVAEPDITARFGDLLPMEASTVTGLVILALVNLYALASLLRLKPLRIRSFQVTYPAPAVVAVAAGGRADGTHRCGRNHLFRAARGRQSGLCRRARHLSRLVLGGADFARAGQLGVLELVFVMGLPDMNQADVIAALLVFRLFYLLIPLAIALLVIPIFGRSFAPSSGAAATQTRRDLQCAP